MASLPAGPGQGFGSLATMGAKLALKAALSVLLNSRNLIDHIAAAAYQEETNLEFSKLSAGDKALWINRVQSVIRAASGTVGL